ncbi:MAG: hypothetical protein ACLURV_07395 [Gallintestinimicrobium sp.]
MTDARGVRLLDEGESRVSRWMENCSLVWMPTSSCTYNSVNRSAWKEAESVSILVASITEILAMADVPEYQLNDRSHFRRGKNSS